MALHFTGGSSDKVTIANASSIQTLASGTVAGWFYLDSISNNRYGLVSKAKASAGGWAVQRVGSDGSKFLFFNSQTGGLPTSRSVTGTLTTGWQFLAAVWNDTTANASILYRGTLSASVSAVTLEASSTFSGPIVSDSGNTLRLSQIEDDATGRSNDGAIAWIGLWNRALSLGELKDQQFNPHVTSGCVLHMFPGFNGTGTQPDWSGNGNSGTVTGATQYQSAPFRSPFGAWQPAPYAVTAPTFLPAWARGCNQVIAGGLYV